MVIATLVGALLAQATERWHGGIPKNVYTGGNGWIVLTFQNEPVDCTATRE